MKHEVVGHLQHLVITGIVGFAYFLLGQQLYPFLTETLWSPLGIAVYFLLFALVMYITMFVLNQIRRDYSFWHQHGRLDMWRDAYKRGALCLLALFLAAGALEFLYELGNREPEPATSYIFLIDDSGSMQSNDPSLRRVDAIKAIMSKQPNTFPYAVYGFTEDAELIKAMGSYEEDDEFAFESSGNTDILSSLNSVLEALSGGTMQAGSAPRILLLSDGESSPWGWRKIASDSRDSNVVVSCIGFGYDSGLLRNIAERTGGVFIQVDEVSELAEQMEEAISSSSNRNLISSRVAMNMDWIYAMLRVLFLCVLGFIWSLMKYETYCSANADMNDKVFKLSLGMCVISSVLVEVLFQYFWVSPAMVRMLFCVLWALTPGFFVVDKNLEFTPGNGGAPASSSLLSGSGNRTSILSSGSRRQPGDYRLDASYGSDRDAGAPETYEGFEDDPFTSSSISIEDDPFESIEDSPF